jgi:hypothetical protein
VDDNKRLKDAGNKLAQAAAYTATNYDGCHRLLLAVGEWYRAQADEGNRGTAATQTNNDLARATTSSDTKKS